MDDVLAEICLRLASGKTAFVTPPRGDGLGQGMSPCRNPAAGGARRQFIILETKHG